MHPKLICEEYLPPFAVENDLDVIVQGILDKPLIISSIVAYDKLSELCIRMFQAGFIFNEMDGSVTDIIKGPSGKEVHANPCCVVVFRRIGKGPIPSVLA